MHSDAQLAVPPRFPTWLRFLGGVGTGLLLDGCAYGSATAAFGHAQWRGALSYVAVLSWLAVLTLLALIDIAASDRRAFGVGLLLSPLGLLGVVLVISTIWM